MASNPIFQPAGSGIAGPGEINRVSDLDPRLVRTHYFDGRLLTAEDLTRDQIYLDQRLREVGQTLGRGVVRGLQLSLDSASGVLRLEPGLGVTAAGRVLELRQAQSIDLLAERADIVLLNNGANRRFNRGLYAVVLRYAETLSEIAEVFPRDLGAQRGFSYDVVAESVELALVPLPQPLPEQDGAIVRAQLVREFLGETQAAGAIPEDAVGLGVLAIREDRPIWLDPELLRQPLRASLRPGDLQADLSRHYERLFDEIMISRQGSLGGDFAASEYFSLLPPVGSLPKASIDPEGGRQGYFPEAWKIWVAPIRLADLELVRQESLQLAPLDLSSAEPLEIIVLAPLSNRDFGHYAPLLEDAYDAADRLLPHLDLLRLRLYPRQPVHRLGTDANYWRDLWALVDEEQLTYVRRPTRAAETTISALVLARGAGLPAPTESATTTTPADGDSLLQDEDAVFLNRVNLDLLARLRPPVDDAGRTALAELQTEAGDDATLVQRGMALLLRVERRYDAVVWPTLLALSRNNALSDFLTALAGQAPETPTGAAVAAVGTDFSLDAGLLDRWTALD